MANLSTKVLMKGTTAELAEMMKVFNRYLNDMSAQYREKRNCAYLESAKASCGANQLWLGSCSDADILAFLADSTEAEVTADGPYGFGSADECGLLEALADAAPHAAFEAEIGGITVGESVRLKGKLVNGELQLEYGTLTDEWIYDYAEENDIDEDELEDLDVDEIDNSNYWFIQKRTYNPATKSYEFLDDYDYVDEDEEEEE